MFVLFFKSVCFIQTCLHICVRKETQMNTENTNKKTTCNKKTTTAVFPVPAQVVADITGVSSSYVKKIRSGYRDIKSETAAQVQYCDELLVDGQKVLVQTVADIINKQNS